MNIPAKPLFLIFILSMTFSLNGCATRALMSSDRYEKTEPSKQQFDSSKQVQDVEQAYQQALLQQDAVAIN
jgi:outer membrane lipoprotein SlyB